MNRSDLYKNLAKYFAGESSKEEAEEINLWLKEDKNNQILFNELESVWQSSNPIEKKFDSEKAWVNVKLKMADPEERFEKASPHVFNRIFSNPGLLKIAASIAVLIILSFFVLNQFGSNNEIPSTAETISSGKNEIKKVRLDDGTLVTLNSESSLTITDSFNKLERMVGLSGEAYFEVAPNKQKPFFVNANGAIVRVVGTKFNVTAWNEDSDVTVAVSEGKVEFNSVSPGGNDGVVVEKGEVSFISKGDAPIKPIKLEVEKYYLFWLNDELNFYNASFKSVIQRLEMKYNVDIAVDDISILSKHLTANFKEEPLPEILNTISIALNLGYSVNKNKVIFNFIKSNKNK